MTKINGDVAVTGEGEVSAYETVEAVRLGKDLKNVSGISYLDENKKVITNDRRSAQNIEEFPDIDWSFFDVESYIKRADVMPDSDDEDIINGFFKIH